MLALERVARRAGGDHVIHMVHVLARVASLLAGPAASLLGQVGTKNTVTHIHTPKKMIRATRNRQRLYDL